MARPAEKEGKQAFHRENSYKIEYTLPFAQNQNKKLSK
jgi:hypothetical protein